MGQTMGIMSGELETKDNPNGFDSRAVNFIQEGLSGSLRDENPNSLFFILKKDNPTNSAELEDVFELRTSAVEIQDIRSVMFHPERPETLYVPPRVGTSGTGYIFYFPLDNGTNTVDILDLDAPTKMIDVCGLGVTQMTLTMLAEFATEHLTQNDEDGRI